mmetsp:Transcript_132213/g.359042  ORF Transcript_132213/g.359042 Transcript_132213/m.359042 type:complete len:89 (-) Transcript_132213:49-315(-)
MRRHRWCAGRLRGHGLAEATKRALTTTLRRTQEDTLVPGASAGDPRPTRTYSTQAWTIYNTHTELGQRLSAKMFRSACRPCGNDAYMS